MIKEEEIRELGKDNQKSYFISNINKFNRFLETHRIELKYID